MNIKNKKGQIAVFLILAFIILIGASFIIYTKDKDKNIDIERVPEVSIEFQPVKNFVEDLETEKGIFEMKNTLTKDRRMQQKAYLLWKYKFITDEQYKKLGSPQPIP